ncbi:MAG: hypothetical protein EBY47_09270 [Actinobacteria bacterium]|nr:hypothetical protein [Actinomycetota bacterium]
MSEDRVDDDTLSLGGPSKYLVTRNERHGHPGIEVGRCSALDEREVGAADTRQQHLEFLPLRRWSLLIRGIIETEGTTSTGVRRAEYRTKP